jgi:hypothetical protein
VTGARSCPCCGVALGRRQKLCPMCQRINAAKSVYTSQRRRRVRYRDNEEDLLHAEWRHLEEIHDVLGGPTGNIGSSLGRDAAWFSYAGFKAV